MKILSYKNHYLKYLTHCIYLYQIIPRTWICLVVFQFQSRVWGQIYSCRYMNHHCYISFLLVMGISIWMVIIWLVYLYHGNFLFSIAHKNNSHLSHKPLPFPFPVGLHTFRQLLVNCKNHLLFLVVSSLQHVRKPLCF